MRIHFLASTLLRGGAETMAVALSRRLHRRGHQIAWTLLRERGPLGADLPGDVAAEIAPGKLPLTAVPRLRNRLRGSHGLYVLDHRNAVVLAAMAAPLAGVPRRALAVHTTGLWGGRPSLDRSVRASLGAFQVVLALSPVHAEYLRDRERVPADRIRIVPNGIDLDRFGALPDPGAARDAIGLAPDARVIGTVAMLRPEKNQRLLLEAAARLAGTRPDLRVVLVGEGAERPALETRAAAEDLRGRVLFLGARADVPDLLPAFSVFVLPSHPAVETQPVSVLEAMAAGVPVVATRVGDLAVMLDEGRAGRLVPCDDLDALVATCGELLDDPAAAAAIAGRGRDRVREYDLEAAASALEEALMGAAA